MEYLSQDMSSCYHHGVFLPRFKPTAKGTTDIAQTISLIKKQSTDTRLGSYHFQSITCKLKEPSAFQMNLTRDRGFLEPNNALAYFSSGSGLL